MKRYYHIFSALFALILVGAVSCVSSPEEKETKANGNYNLSIETRATMGEVMGSMRLYTFHKNGADQNKYKRTLTSTYSGNTIKAIIDAGDWNLAMVSPPSWSVITPPEGGTQAASLPMYVYAPTVSGNKSTDAAEIYTAFVKNVPTITPDGNHTLPENVKVARNVAKVTLTVSSAIGNFKTNGNHKVELYDVPSTISYDGTLIPGKASPTLLTAPLEAQLTLSDVGQGAYVSNSVSFIIPAHKGTDFLADSPTDVIGKKMRVGLTLERTDGSLKTFTVKEVEKVALCNRELQINIKATDGMEFEVKVEPWEEVTIGELVGDKFKGWLHVKKDAAGTGESWSSPLGTISQAITVGQTLRSAGYTVNGILVAGGTSNVYSEGFTLTDDIRIFGGWEGTPGTELPEGDADAPYKSSHRKLKTHKVRVTLGSNAINVNASGALLDGFIIQNVTGSSGTILNVNHSAAAVNAIQIQNVTVARTPLSLSGTAVNMLITDNSRGIAVSGGNLVSSTVTNNATASTISATSKILNTIFWHSAITPTGTPHIEYSAFEGTLQYVANLGGTRNLHLHNNNTAWFTASNPIPGPHFNLTEDASRPAYMASSQNRGRVPMLGYAKKAEFNAYTSFMPDGHKKDIDGNPRFWRTDVSLETDMDMGCYEHDDTYTGFMLRWATKTVYLPAKAAYTSTVPLIILNNDIYNIGVTWNASVKSTMSHAEFQGPPSGNGNDVVVGELSFFNNFTSLSGGNKPGHPTYSGNDYIGATTVNCGTIQLHTDLGGYLPDAEFDVMILPGAPLIWYQGYCGSFHRNNERGARLISGPNKYTKWSARIVSGLDWIKIDGHDNNYVGTYIDGTNPIDGGVAEVNNVNPSAYGPYYKEVEETYGGVVEGTGNVQFRVGMKSKNTTGTPRYGLIALSCGNQEGGFGGGTALFFVRQGEDDDFVYVKGNPRTYGARGRNAVKFSPFSIRDPQNNTATTGRDIGARGGRPTDYPSQVGYYFKWSQTYAHAMGSATGLRPTTNRSSFSSSLDVCPTGYRQGSLAEWICSLYNNAAIPATSTYLNPSGADALNNFVWGRYADGFYDQLAPYPLNIGLADKNLIRWVSYGGSATLPSAMSVSDRPYAATDGILMVSHYNYAAVFFPIGGTMSSSGGLSNYSTTNLASSYCMNWMTDYTSYRGPGRNSHWSGNTSGAGGHIGINCTGIQSNAGPVRCVKDEVYTD